MSDGQIPPPYDKPLRCKWNWKTSRCYMMGTIADSLQGAHVVGKVVINPGFCRFHYDTHNGKAVSSAAGFDDWIEHTRTELREYGRTVWHRFTTEALWKTLTGARELPIIDTSANNQPNPRAKTEHQIDATRAARAVVDGALKADKAIDALHAKHGCPPDCADHPEGNPEFV